MRSFLGKDLNVDEPMSRHTTIGVGGPARFFVAPRTEAQVTKTVRYAARQKIPYVALGKGSNMIVRDGGYDGIVIKMATHMCKIKVNKRSVHAQGGASFAPLARKLTRMGRSGLEFGIGIPGSVGGVVRMNAGAFGGEVKDVLRQVWFVDVDGDYRALRASEMQFAYRHSSLPKGAIVVAASFNCPPGKVRQDVYDRSLGRKRTQPISERTFGSTFVNPEEGFAAEMIEACGLKGLRRGGAMISDMHANFIINVDGNASAADVESLIKLMKESVEKRFGISLKTEVIVIGNR